MPVPLPGAGQQPPPGAPPQIPGGGQPAQKTPPMGSTPAVTPGQNQGMMAAGMQKVGVALKLLTEALGDYGATSEEGQAIAKMITMGGKLAKPGSVSSAGEANTLQKAQFQNAQNGQMLQMLRQQQQQPPQGGAGGQPPVATPPKAMGM